MAIQKTQSLLLIMVLTVLAIWLVQPSYGQDAQYKRFQRQHVDSKGKGGTDKYCNSMMKKRGMTKPKCKSFNTFIHDKLKTITGICQTAGIKCKNGQMNCHAGTAKVTDCKLTGGSKKNCKYKGTGSTRRFVIACNGNPLKPVHFDS